jgi:hypothetical protein
VVTGTTAGTTGTATTVATEIGMTAEGTGTVPRAEGIQVTMDGIADATRSQLPDVNILHPHNTQDMHGCPDKHSLCLVL